MEVFTILRAVLPSVFREGGFESREDGGMNTNEILMGKTA
jgi:hypothetical protein